MILRLYQYFGIVGVTSVTAWMAAIVALLCSVRRAGFSARYGLILILAIIACVLGRISSDRISDIRVDERARVEAIQEERQRLREDADGPGKVHVRFTEDSRKDRLDIAGVHQEEIRAFTGVSEPTPAADDEPAYRQKGKQTRDAGKIKPLTATATAAAQPPAAASVRVMTEEDVTAANRLDRWNLFAVAVTLWLSGIAFLWDYLRRLNTTFQWRFPLPITGHWLDSIFPKSRTVMMRRPAEPVMRMFLEGVVRKGETFLYLGDRRLWHASWLWRLPFAQWIAAVRSTEGEWRQRLAPGIPHIIPRLARATGKGMVFLFRWLCRGKARDAVRRFCSRLRSLPVGMWLEFPLPVIVYGAEGVPSDSDFVFDALWFNRYGVIVPDREAAGRLMRDLLSYLDRRSFTRATARRTVNVVWDFSSSPDEATIERLACLSRDTNLKFILSACEPVPATDSFDEIWAEDIPLLLSFESSSDPVASEEGSLR